MPPAKLALVSNREKDLRRIAYLIWWHFGEDDEYASYDDSKNFDYIVEERYGDIVAYLVYHDYDSAIEGIRSGVVRDWRRNGLAQKLYERMLVFAKKKQKPYWTYTSWDNLASLNAHLRAGMDVERIKKDGFIYVISKGWFLK